MKNKARYTYAKSIPAGNPMMPMNGAYHGHTRQIALTTVFPTTRFYIINVDTNSLPVSNVQYDHANTRLVIVTEATESTDS
ncbi:MAG: hypothetical protein QXK74_02135 [Candidatus Nitrosocaldaceae archaeon]